MTGERQTESHQAEVTKHDGLPGYWVCERCGQPLDADGRCNSGLHVGPGEEANGMAIHTTDLAALAAASVSGTEPDTAKLVEYATHKPECRLRRTVERDLTPRGSCTCGLADLLAGFSVDTGKAHTRACMAGEIDSECPCEAGPDGR